MNRVELEVEARFVDNLSGPARAAASKTQSELNKLEKKPIKPIFDAENNKFLRKVREAEEKARRLGHTKTAVVLSAIDKATNIIGKVLNKAHGFAGRTWSAYLKVRDSNALASLKHVGRMGKEFAGKTWRATLRIVDRATAPLRMVKNMLFSIQTLVAGIAAGWAANKLIAQPVGLADSIESSRIAFENKLGSAQAANDFLQKIYKFDEKSPFDTMQIVKITQQMMNMGFAANTVLDDLETIGDWAASMGKGEDGIQRVTLALGQMRQKGKLSSEEMLQLTEAGVSGWEYLARGMGKTIPEIRKMAEKGNIDVNAAIAAILAGMKEFEGAAAATSDRTVGGIFDQMKSLIQTYVVLPWGEGLSKGLKKGLAQVRDLLDRNKDKFKAWGAELKDIGAEASEWFANKVENAIRKINEITKRADFQNADFGGKVKILWDEIIAEPFSRWWDGSGRQVFMSKAVDIGTSIGQGIAEGLWEAFKALPWWGQAALGAYGGAQMLGLAGGAINGVKALGSLVGSTGTAMVQGSGVAGGLATMGYSLAGGAAGSTMSGGMAALAGGATVAGIGAGVVSSGMGAYDLYKGIKNNDKAKKKAGAWELGAGVAGLALGALLGGPVGAAIGGVIGGGIGLWQGHKAKKEAEEAAEAIRKAAIAEEEARAKAEKLAAANMPKHFGDIALSADEVQQSVNNLFGKDLVARTQKGSEAIAAMEKSLKSFDSVNSSLKKSLWLTTLKKGAKLSGGEVDNLKNGVQAFGQSAKTYLTDAQYASSESISSLVKNQKDAEKVLSASQKYYDKQKDALAGLNKELSEKMSKALSDGVISLDEEKSLQKLRSQISDVMAQIQKDEYQAKLNIIDAKYGGDGADLDSVKAIMEQGAAAAEGMSDTIWQKFGKGSIGLKKGTEEFKTLMKGTLDELTDTWDDVANLGIDKIQDGWGKELGILGSDFSVMMKENTIPQIKEAASGLTEETRLQIGEMLKYMEPTTEQMKGLAKKYEEMGMQIPPAISEYLNTVEFYEALSKGPKAVEEYFNNTPIDVEPKIKIANPEIDTELDKVFSVKANVETEWTYDKFDDEWISPDGNYSFSTQALVNAGWTYDEFKGEWISPDGQYTFSTAGLVKVGWTYDPFKREWISPDGSYSFSTTANVHVRYRISGTMTETGIKGHMNKMAAELYQDGFIHDARGGIEYPTGYNVKRYAAGGMVRGGAKLIKVAEEGTPEMIIPLGSQRRERGLKLWEKAGEMLGVDHFFRGGRTDNGDEGLRFHHYGSGEPVGGQNVEVDVGGVNVTIQVDAKGSDNIVEAIKAQGNEIAETVAGILVDAFGGQFENTPVRGGA